MRAVAAGEWGGRRAACCMEEIMAVCRVRATFCKDLCNSSWRVITELVVCALELDDELVTAVSIVIARISDILDTNDESEGSTVMDFGCCILCCWMTHSKAEIKLKIILFYFEWIKKKLKNKCKYSNKVKKFCFVQDSEILIKVWKLSTQVKIFW